MLYIVFMNWNIIKYEVDGLFRRLRQTPLCPSCGAIEYQRVDKKGVHLLLGCNGCELLYRWPYEGKEEMAQFYQRDYHQAGLTTDLPSLENMNSLLTNEFKGSEKDFSRIVKLLHTLNIRSGAKILDYGANWGYGVWQFRKAGFNAIGYELSVPRAAYGEKLGIEVFTKWPSIVENGPYDVVFSSHVLEHTPDPASALHFKFEMVLPGGLLIALFPNGSKLFQKSNPTVFHRLWGRVHPVMLNEQFVRRAIPAHIALAIGSFCMHDLEKLSNWDRSTDWIGSLGTDEMLIVGAAPSR